MFPSLTVNTPMQKLSWSSPARVPARLERARGGITNPRVKK
jgi:hypothetical protein